MPKLCQKPIYLKCLELLFEREQRVWSRRIFFVISRSPVRSRRVAPFQIINKTTWLGSSEEKRFASLAAASPSTLGNWSRYFRHLGVVSPRCFRLNFRSKSGQNSFKILEAMSTPSCTLRLDTALEAVRLSA